MAGLFKGFNQIDLLREEPRVLCAILGAQLALSNQAITAQQEEIKQLREHMNKRVNKE